MEQLAFQDAFNTHMQTAQPEDAQVDNRSVALAPNNGTLTDYDPDLVCGDSSTEIDSDLDTLSDFVELCLGTDAYNSDTDFDGIADNIEVEGFEINGVRWYSNPHEPDSNLDGVPDFLEWPAPIGSADSHDIDGDKIPNLWDSDNDDDLVPDYLDLSPFSTTAYQTEFSYESSVGQRDYDGWQILEMQLT